jgi:hypothetical protein
MMKRMKPVMRMKTRSPWASTDGNASFSALSCLFGVPMPKGEKRVESRTTGFLDGCCHFAQAIATLFASYLACAICFPEPFATLNNSCVDKLLYA